MATFIKTGFWEKRTNPPQGYKGELNLEQLIQQNAGGGSIATDGSSLYSTSPSTSGFSTNNGIFLGANAAVSDGSGISTVEDRGDAFAIQDIDSGMNSSIPDPFGVDYGDRTVGTDAKAVGLSALDAAVFGEAELLELRLQMFPGFRREFAAAARLLGRLHAKEDMPAGGAQSQRLGCAGGFRVHSNRGIRPSCSSFRNSSRLNQASLAAYWI